MLESSQRPPRSAGTSALRAALAQIVGFAVVLAAIEIALYPSLAGALWLLATFSVLGVLFVVAGALAWARRPSNRMGALLVLGGVMVLVAAGGNTSLPLLARVGEYAAVLPLAVVVHLLLAFPSGRLRHRLPRLITAAAYLSALGLQAGQIVGDDPAAWSQAQNVFGALITGLTAAVLVHRARAATSFQRRTLTPLYAYGTFTMLAIVFSAQVLSEWFGVGPFGVFGVQQAVIAGVPLAFLAGVLRGGFARTGELAELGSWLGTADGARPTLREALAATLGDPTLELWFWLPEEGRYVDV